jgi:hypothetical protein
MHKSSLELLIRCASFVGKVLKALCGASPHTYSCTYLFKQKNKVENEQGLCQLDHWGA